MKFSYSRRYSLVITLLACAAMLAMLYLRFGLTSRTILEYILLLVFLCILLLGFAALVAFMLRKIHRGDEFDD